MEVMNETPSAFKKMLINLKFSLLVTDLSGEAKIYTYNKHAFTPLKEAC